MLEKDSFDSLRRSREAEYFIEREQELISKLRRRVNLETELRRLLANKEEANQEIMQDLEALGYRRATLSVLHLVPLVRIAWAEGFVTERERGRIFEIARLRGIEPGSLPYEQLSEWLTHRPSEEFFEKTLGIIQTMLEALPPEEREAGKRNLVAYCKQVAAASGGILHLWGHTSDEEHAAIDHIAAELEREHYTASRRVLESA